MPATPPPTSDAAGPRAGDPAHSGPGDPPARRRTLRPSASGPSRFTAMAGLATAAALATGTPVAATGIGAILPGGSGSSPPGDRESNLPSLFMGLGILILGITIIRAVRRRLQHNRRAQPPPEVRREQLAEHVARAPWRERRDPTEAEMSALDAGQRMAAALDAKCQRLEGLLARADVQIAALERPGLAEGAAPDSGSASASRATVRPVRSSRSASATSRAADATPPMTTPPASEDVIEPARPEVEIPAGPRNPAMPGRRSAEIADELARRVHAMADAGHDPVHIARSLDEHVGKIELILALREPPLTPGDSR